MKTKAYFGTPEEKNGESERKNERRKQIKSLNQKHKHSHTFTDQQIQKNFNKLLKSIVYNKQVEFKR